MRIDDFKNILRRPTWVVAIASGSIVVIGWLVAMQSRRDASSWLEQQTATRSTVEVGGIQRPLRDVERASRSRGIKATEVASQKTTTSVVGSDFHNEEVYPFGATPLISRESSKVVEAAYNAIKNVSPESEKTVNLFAQLEPFDLARYQANPQEYLDAIEPARVWQSAQPGEGVPRIRHVDVPNKVLTQGETIRLRVQTAAEAPVTYASFDMGAFQNQLAVITVAADKQGIAEAEFTGTPGTIAGVRVLAVSPVASGNAEFFVQVLPRK